MEGGREGEREGGGREKGKKKWRGAETERRHMHIVHTQSTIISQKQQHRDHSPPT